MSSTIRTNGSAAALRLPEPPQEEGERFAQDIQAYLGGTLTPDEFKRCRLQMGVYGIRGLKDRHMIRVKVPAGQLNADQLEGLSRASRDYATGRGHATTRQAIQLYDIAVQRLPQLLAELAEVGLTSREACGNTVRNVTACPFTGICADELFDVSPYARAVVRHFLRNAVSQSLPRKFKISFSGCAIDCAMSAIHDIGAVAARREGAQGMAYGFTLYVGGGLGANPRSGDRLEPFTPVGQLLPTCEAIVRVFDRHGDRANRSRARMKFLLERIGADAFRRLVVAERDALLREPGRFALLPEPEPINGPDAKARALPSAESALLRRWLGTNVRPQRQAGYWIVTVRLILGDMSAEQMGGLARLSREHGTGRLVTTPWQDICLPWVPTNALAPLHAALAALGLGEPDAERIQDITSCPGADTCQIGITSSRGLAGALMRVLKRPEYAAKEFASLRIKISGCPNSCGQHHIADIGLFGAAKNVAGRLIPHYQLLVGGRTAPGVAEFGLPVVRLPAKRVPEAVQRLLDDYRSRRQDGEAFRVYATRVGLPALQALLEPCATLEPGQEAAAAEDWGQTTPFSLAGMGKGECAG